MAGLYVIIAGAGKVGWNLARELLEKGHEVTVLEQDRRRYLTVEQELEHAVQYGDATELWVLERAGIQRADLVVAVTGDDAVSYTHLRAHETPEHLVCRLLLE